MSEYLDLMAEIAALRTENAALRERLAAALAIMHSYNACPIITIDQANEAFQQVGAILENSPQVKEIRALLTDAGATDAQPDAS